MSGNTRGKLKEHFEGIHRNIDWSIRHANMALLLIREQLSFTEDFVNAVGDVEKEEQVLMNYPLYAGIKGMGESLQTFDDIANGLYAHI